MRWTSLLLLVVPMLFSLNAEAAGRIPDYSVFEGRMSDGGLATFRSTIGTDMQGSFDFGGPPPRGCQSTYAHPYPLRSDGRTFGQAADRTSLLSNVHVFGFVDDLGFQAAAGFVMADGPEGSVCGKYRATWIATRPALEAPLPPGGTTPASRYRGPSTSASTPDGAGTLTFSTDAAGAVVALRLEHVVGSCTYRLVQPSTAAPVAPMRASFQMVADGGSVAAVAGGSGFDGVAILSAPGCADIGVTWRATIEAAQAATAVPTPPPAARGVGSFLAPPTFGAGPTAGAVFGGGDVNQLEAAARDAGAAGVWLQDGSGTFQLLVVGAPPFLRESFERAFPSGVAGPVAVTLTR